MVRCKIYKQTKNVIANGTDNTETIETVTKTNQVIVYIPILIIDMVVASTLMSMGMMMLPPTMISLPFKLLIFILVDGWNLLITSVVSGFVR